MSDQELMNLIAARLFIKQITLREALRAKKAVEDRARREAEALMIKPIGLSDPFSDVLGQSRNTR